MLELPPGYERRIKIDTQEIFYVNHNTRTTSWIHPKIEQLLIPEEELNVSIIYYLFHFKCNIECEYTVSKPTSSNGNRKSTATKLSKF